MQLTSIEEVDVRVDVEGAMHHWKSMREGCKTLAMKRLSLDRSSESILVELTRIRTVDGVLAFN